MPSYSKFVIWFPVLIIVLHISFLGLNLYSSISILDVFMHFLGGVWVAMLFFYLFGNLFRNELYFNNTEIVKIFIIAVSFVAFIGVLWELFEFITTVITSIQFQGDLPDTMKDLFVDIIGGMFGGIIGMLHMRKLE